MKSETVNNYLALSKKMDNLLEELRVKFKKELRAIIGITQEQIDKLDVSYIDEKNNIVLYYKMSNDEILNKCLGCDDNINYIFAKIDLNTEKCSLYDSRKYMDEMLDLIIKGVLDKIKEIEDQKNILYEKNKSFWFRLFHPDIEYAINTMNQTIKGFDELKQTAEKEKRYIREEFIDPICKTFIEEMSSTYGFMNILVTKENIENE